MVIFLRAASVNERNNRSVTVAALMGLNNLFFYGS